MKYKIHYHETELKAWPYAVQINFTDPAMINFSLRNRINDWLQLNRIRYNYSNNYQWYFKNQRDVTMFVVRWS
jgi:hypothetical protein